jgi:peptidoglycan-N-acetylglucosamine deacetylase
MTKPIRSLLTTSWDDGHPFDLRIAEMLAKWNIPGTFYVPRMNPERDVMDEGAIRQLSAHFEIGGHTLHHVTLDKLTLDAAYKEIAACRSWLGDVTGHVPVSFCYPRGRFVSSTVDSVRKAGYKYARTVQLLKTGYQDDLKAPTTLQVYPHTRWEYLQNALKRADLPSCAFVLTRVSKSLGIQDLTEVFLDNVQSFGGVFHLWGHSWEIEELGLWGTLDDLLRLIAERDQFARCVNGVLPEYWSGED